jgi:hypothetical protein
LARRSRCSCGTASGSAPRRAAYALGIALAESGTYVSNNQVCPLTLLAEEFGAESGAVVDMFLPGWAARRIPQFGTAALVLGLLLSARDVQPPQAVGEQGDEVVRLFYFVGGPTDGHCEAFLRRLAEAGGSPPAGGLPAMLCVTLNMTLNGSREADSEHESGRKSDGC